jgi:hypothetical protein
MISWIPLLILFLIMAAGLLTVVYPPRLPGANFGRPIATSTARCVLSATSELDLPRAVDPRKSQGRANYQKADSSVTKFFS